MHWVQFTNAENSYLENLLLTKFSYALHTLIIQSYVKGHWILTSYFQKTSVYFKKK